MPTKKLSNHSCHRIIRMTTTTRKQSARLLRLRFYIQYGDSFFWSRIDFGHNIDYNIIVFSYRGEEMDFMAELAVIAKEHGGIIDTKTAAEHGCTDCP